jgi:hypothetical protein
MPMLCYAIFVTDENCTEGIFGSSTDEYENKWVDGYICVVVVAVVEICHRIGKGNGRKETRDGKKREKR